MKKITIITLFCLSLFACKKEDSIAIFNIASERFESQLQDEVNAGVWLLSRQSQNEQWTLLARDIDGFVYERGYEYIIKVEIDVIKPHIDQSPINFRLIKIISKEKRDTDIPDEFKNSLFKE